MMAYIMCLNMGRAVRGMSERLEQESRGIGRDLEAVDSMIDDLQQTLHRYFNTEHSDKRGETLFVTETAVRRKIQRYSRDTERLLESYDPVEVTAEPGTPAYEYERALAEDITKLENRAAYLDELEDAFPDAMDELDGLPLY